MGLSVYLEPGNGENGEYIMKKIIKKTKHINDKPIGRMTIMADFLPPPSQLVPREDNVRVTLSLSRSSVEFFKHEAEENHVPYQRMIRALLEQYTKQQMNT